jgi:signal transduction histidine kinase
MAPSRSWLQRPLLNWSIGIAAAVIAGAALFHFLGISIFHEIGMPHEFCYLQDARLVGLHVSSDLLIGLAYVSISLTLGYLVYKASQGIPFHWVFLAFGLFIISCAFTHFLEVLVIWRPYYWLAGYVKLLTAVASVATAVALFPLVPKVFALVQSVRQSEERKREIEQLNSELERFNYSVAHDLRGPLRSIAGFSEALREDLGASLTPVTRDYVDRMQRSVGRMDALISDLLRYAVIGRQELALTQVDLSAVLQSTCEFLAEEIRACGGSVVAPQPLPAVIGDATLLQVIFQNLIGNALKFVPPGTTPRVEVTVRSSAHALTVLFTDNGMGIPADSREQIFGMFQRLHPEIPGTGMGLRIVHRAVERLNGRIGLEAAPQGTGSQFWIELPTARGAQSLS